MKKYVKRCMAFVLALSMTFSISACSASKNDNPNPSIQEGEKQELMKEEINKVDNKEDNKENNKEDNKDILTGNSDETATQLFKAEYPEMVKYPITEEGSYNHEEYEAWMQCRIARQPENTEYQNGIREFYEITMQEFLKGTPGENKVYSPLNVYMALAMLAETTEGESRQQILDLLHTDSIETLRSNANILWNANYCDEGTVNSLLASSVWLSDQIKYNEDTLKILADNYYASSFSGVMGSQEYNKMLQDWLNEQTGGLLEEQAGNVEMDPATVFSLTTTVYFRAKWQNEFYDPNNTEDVFHAKSGDMLTEFMHQSGTGTYYWGENFSAIVRGLKNSGNMLLILPDEDVEVEDLLADKEVQNFIFDHSVWENQKFLIVNQSVPKFDVVSDFSLISGLKNLGVKDVFDFSEADFTPLMGENTEIPVAVNEAKHAARVMIDEEGCTAAAFTVMIACGAARPPEEKVDFVLDRPFLFVINGQDGQPLFVGVVNQPK